MASEAYERVAEAHAELKESIGAPPDTGTHELDRTMSREPRTTVPKDTLLSLGDQLLRCPRASRCTASCGRSSSAAARRSRIGRPIDWAHAEALAFASLLALGVPIRLTGQDTERGTFSQRHAVLHDAKTGERYSPLQHLRDANAPFELHNSPLSEQACMGFEYGYSVQAPDALVLWEAQFGDFVNGAQVIIDQFIVSGLAKWGQTSRLTLLLPHGYEGSGPEHSSGRARALPPGGGRGQHPRGQLHHAGAVLPPAAPPGAGVEAAPADRDDAQEPAAPAGGQLDALEDLAEGHFQRVIDDPRFADGGREAVTKLVLCSGKIYYDIAGHEERDRARAHRDRARGAALPVPRGGPAGADGELPQPRARGLGAGGAAQHGRARVHAPPHGEDPARADVVRLRRPPAARRHRRGLLRPRTSASRRASCAWRWTSRTTGSSRTAQLSAR